MNDWVTIATFTYPSQAVILKGRFESEGIECYLKDELTAQVNPFYSNAIGGVKLQVMSQDVPKAVVILRELGYPVDDDESYETSVKKIVRFTQKIPIINKLPIERRYTVLLLGVVAVLVIVSVFIYLLAGLR